MKMNLDNTVKPIPGETTYLLGNDMCKEIMKQIHKDFPDSEFEGSRLAEEHHNSFDALVFDVITSIGSHTVPF